MRRVRVSIFSHGKAINVTYSGCVSLALIIHNARRMRRIIFPSVACLAVSFFSTLFHKRYDFIQKVIEQKMYVLIFSTKFVLNISHSTKN
jgi:purine-cytosine permease-like protein